MPFFFFFFSFFPIAIHVCTYCKCIIPMDEHMLDPGVFILFLFHLFVGIVHVHTYVHTSDKLCVCVFLFFFGSFLITSICTVFRGHY